PADKEITAIVEQMEDDLKTAERWASAATEEAFVNARGQFKNYDKLVKQAETASAKVNERIKADIKARTEYDSAMLKAEEALAEVAVLPGQGEIYALIRQLINDCRIEPKGLLTFGHAAMLAKLNDDKTGYAAMAREAARLEKQRVKQASYDPTVAKDHADCEQM